MRYRVIIAFFSKQSQTDDAVEQLQEEGIAREAIRLLPKEVVHLDDIGVQSVSKAPEGAACGGLVGGAIGALVGSFFAGGSLVIPSFGIVLAGAVVSAFAFAGAFGVLGSIVGAVIGAYIPEYEARYLDDALRSGGALLAVRCGEERARRIEELLVMSGGRCLRKSASRLALASLH